MQGPAAAGEYIIAFANYFDTDTTCRAYVNTTSGTVLQSWLAGRVASSEFPAGIRVEKYVETSSISRIIGFKENGICWAAYVLFRPFALFCACIPYWPTPAFCFGHHTKA